MIASVTEMPPPAYTRIVIDCVINFLLLCKCNCSRRSGWNDVNVRQRVAVVGSRWPTPCRPRGFWEVLHAAKQIRLMRLHSAKQTMWLKSCNHGPHTATRAHAALSFSSGRSADDTDIDFSSFLKRNVRETFKPAFYHKGATSIFVCPLNKKHQKLVVLFRFFCATRIKRGKWQCFFFFRTKTKVRKRGWCKKKTKKKTRLRCSQIFLTKAVN